jgi:hypothetical protein
MSEGMTEVEILLSVDAGRNPPDTVTIFMDDRDPDERARWRARFLVALAVLLAGGAIALGWMWGKKALTPITLMLLGAGMAVVGATPTTPEAEPRPQKRPVMVVTTTGLIVRGDWGVKMWRFEDLSDIVAGVDSERRPLLELRDKDGTRYRLRCSGFRCWMRAQQAVTPRLTT